MESTQRLQQELARSLASASLLWREGQFRSVGTASLLETWVRLCHLAMRMKAHD